MLYYSLGNIILIDREPTYFVMVEIRQEKGEKKILSSPFKKSCGLNSLTNIRLVQ